MSDVTTEELEWWQIRAAQMMQHRQNADSRQVGGDHYKAMPIEPWEVMRIVLTREEYEGFLKGSYLKYALRAGRKPGADDDAEKARHYAQKLSEIQDGYAGF